MIMVFLGWDRKLYTVSLQALWSNSSSNIYCQLKEIERTSQWVSWLKGCERRETSPIALVEGRPSQATAARQLVLVLGRACNQLMSLLWAVKTLKEVGPDEETPWLDLQSRWCMRHLVPFFSHSSGVRIL
jgi:hypothetical protein